MSASFVDDLRGLHLRTREPRRRRWLAPDLMIPVSLKRKRRQMQA